MPQTKIIRKRKSMPGCKCQRIYRNPSVIYACTSSMCHVGVIFSNGDLSVCREKPVILATAWVVEDLHGSPLVNNSSRCNTIPVLKLCLVIRDGQLGLCVPHYLEIWRFKSLSYMHIFYEVSSILGFHTSSQMPLKFSCLLRCPKIEEWIKKVGCISTMECHSAIKKWHHKICR